MILVSEWSLPLHLIDPDEAAWHASEERRSRRRARRRCIALMATAGALSSHVVGVGRCEK